ncbi:uncharacterized protein BDZ99DRAFT_529475 [Mytilinidion resinicola]|uniref:Uncharacterized protein n=1 Tax=Mytilinidion resinicola TaxID=574789 RepID=A0A6A6Z7V3_9PEZI|nr:uncharacterized protein BDZ99DRAFT_529475 [Mytilinidion resinicola]KAF2817191.1 hypothetical protein BDZ99DRAFT_529475 [Mytilinidion resinicola]
MNLMMSHAMGVGHGRYPSIFIDTHDAVIPVDGKAMLDLLPKFATDAERRGLRMDVYQMTERVRRSQGDANSNSLFYAISLVVDTLSRRLGVEASKVNLLERLEGLLQQDAQRMSTYGRGLSRFPQCLSLFGSLANVARYSKSQPISSILSTFFLQNGAIIARKENPDNIIRWWKAIRKLVLDEADKAMCFQQILKGKPSIMSQVHHRTARNHRLLNEFLRDMMYAASLRPGNPHRGMPPPPRVPPPRRMGEFHPGFFEDFPGVPGPLDEDGIPMSPGWVEDDFEDNIPDYFPPHGFGPFDIDESLEAKVYRLEDKVNEMEYGLRMGMIAG